MLTEMSHIYSYLASTFKNVLIKSLYAPGIFEKCKSLLKQIHNKNSKK